MKSGSEITTISFLKHHRQINNISPTAGNQSILPPAIQKLLSGPQFGALKDLVSGLTTGASPTSEASPQSPTDELEAALNIAGGMSQDLQTKHKVSCCYLMEPNSTESDL